MNVCRPSSLPSGYAHKDKDGKLNFRGFVATTDGKETMEVTRVGDFTPEGAVKAGTDAGNELKAKARPGFFMW